MADTARARKLADRIQEIVAETLEKRVKDPRLGFVTDHRRPGDRRPAARHGLLHRLRRRRGAGAPRPRALESAKGVLRSRGRQADRHPAHADAGVHRRRRPGERRAHRGPAAPRPQRDAEVAALAAGAAVRRRGRPVPARGRDELDDDGRRATRPPASRRRRRPDGGRADRGPRPTACSSSTSRPGWTSHDVVARARRLGGTRQVGHAGTLDPMATGVLVLGVGRATRLLTYLVGADKDVHRDHPARRRTVTDDAEGEVTAGRAAPSAPARPSRPASRR